MPCIRCKALLEYAYVGDRAILGGMHFRQGACEGTVMCIWMLLAVRSRNQGVVWGHDVDYRWMYILDAEPNTDIVPHAGGRRERFVAKDVSVGKGQVGAASYSPLVC